MSHIILGGGCFWCLEAVFQRLPGVEAVRSGYAGGHTSYPTYTDICRGDTGHAEVVEIHFEPHRIGLDELLDVFFLAHDPTTADRQGNDIGPQYRSIILFGDQGQKVAAEAAMARAQKYYAGTLVTELKALQAFYAAESEHHDYFNRHPSQPYCQWVIQPKLNKLQLAE